MSARPGFGFARSCTAKGLPPPDRHKPTRRPGTFRVIYADPNWEYKNMRHRVHGAARAHYQTEGEAGLLALAPAIEAWSDDDSVLVLWATWPKLDVAVRLIAAWGYQLVTGCPWVKTTATRAQIKTGIGFWWQSASEVLLIAKRGKARARKMPLLALLTGPDRQFYDVRRRHSEKPIGIADWIERKMDGPYLELFATAQREGWTCYGRGLGTEITPAGVVKYVKKAEKGGSRTRSTRHERAQGPCEPRHAPRGVALRESPTRPRKRSTTGSAGIHMSGDIRKGGRR